MDRARFDDAPCARRTARRPTPIHETQERICPESTSGPNIGGHGAAGAKLFNSINRVASPEFPFRMGTLRPSLRCNRVGFVRRDVRFDMPIKTKM